MVESIMAHWEMIVLSLLTFGFIELLLRLQNYWARRRPLSDEEYLAYLARKQNTSEYEIFIREATHWAQRKSRAEEQFKIYLKTGQMPHYVRDYVRKARKTEASNRS
jgi:predicted AAA+ superfamily ATPase